MKRFLRLLAASLTCLITVTVAAQSFYEARFLGGVTDFNRGAYARAVDELRIAAFGRVDDVARYEIAEVYLTLANDKLNHAEDAKVAALKVVQAEQASAVYTTLDLPREIRAAFEALLPSLLTREQLTHAAAFDQLANQAPLVQPGTPRTTTRSNQPVPTPTKEPNVATTVKKNNDDVQPPDVDYGRLALERVAAGDEAGGRRYADLALARDQTNANAHAALAQIARAHQDWRGVAWHYAIVQTKRRLSDDESADYFIALVKTNRPADAIGVRRGLSPAVLARTDVRDAIQVIDPSPVPKPLQPAPQPSAPRQSVEQTPEPKSVQQPVEPRRTVPQPIPQPQVSRPPAPQPVAPQPPALKPPAPSPVPQPTRPMPPSTLQTPEPLTQPQIADSREPVSAQIAAAERLLSQSNVVGARTELRRIVALPGLERSERLLLGRALSQSALYEESSIQYRKTYPLKAGEEAHMFYEAVNRYQLGDFDLARQLITRAMPALPQTPAILAYRDRILAQH